MNSDRIIERDNIVKAMDNASSIENLLRLKWYFNKKFGSDYHSIKYNAVARNVERISYDVAILNSTSIINELVNGSTIENIKDKYNITTEAINRLLLLYIEKGSYSDKIINRLASPLDIVPEHDREFICAKSAIKLFMDNNLFNIKSVFSGYNCNIEEYNKYLNILKAKDHPLYFKYKKLQKDFAAKTTYESKAEYRDKKREDKIKTIESVKELDSKEILDVLSNIHSKEYINFCLYYKLDSRVLVYLLNDNESLKEEFATNKDHITDIYNKYINKYKDIVRELIYDIIMLSKDGFREPIDLYHYYLNTKYDMLALSRLALTFTDVKNNKLLSRYIEKNTSLFKGIVQKEIDGYKQRGIISCANDSISFTKEELNKAIDDIHTNNLPMIKGVLYSAIKRQVAFRDSLIQMQPTFIKIKTYK